MAAMKLALPAAVVAAGTVLAGPAAAAAPSAEHTSAGTVAAKAHMKSCKRLAHDINTARRTLRGSLPTMELIDVDSPRVQSLRTLQLGQQQVSG